MLKMISKSILETWLPKKNSIRKEFSINILLSYVKAYKL